APFTVQLPPSSNLFETGRYYGDLSEYSINNGIDYTWSFAGFNQAKSNLKVGSYVDYRFRDFNSRYFSYLYPGFFDSTVGQEISQLPLDEIFSNENIRTLNGLVIEEGTRPIDSYNASNLLSAGYISTDIPVGRFDISTGVRMEYNIQTMNSRDDFKEIKVNNPLLSALPFINTGYNISDKSILRLA